MLENIHLPSRSPQTTFTFAPPLTIDNFSIETRLKTVNSGGKNLGFGDERSWGKNLGFGGGFGYRNNTNKQ